MRIIVGEKEKNLKLVQEFAKTNYWLEEYAEFFSEDFVLELPFAPPGWIQNMSVGETLTHFEWLRRTVRNWRFEQGKVYSTNFPDIFWLMRRGGGDVFWAGKDGYFSSRFITRVKVKKGKIVHMKDHFDNCKVYKAIGITLPKFIYDAMPADELPDRSPVPDVTGDPELLAKKTGDTINSFVSVDFWEEDCGEIYSNNIVHELPFTPPDMPRRYTAKEYNALNLWLQKNVKTWDVYPGTVLYETDDPGEYIIESSGGGFMTWSGIPRGFYQNRHVSYLKVVDGYAVEFFEYFNPINKFNSINVNIPSVPYLF